MEGVREQGEEEEQNRGETGSLYPQMNAEPVIISTVSGNSSLMFVWPQNNLLMKEAFMFPRINQLSEMKIESVWTHCAVFWEQNTCVMLHELFKEE